MKIGVVQDSGRQKGLESGTGFVATMSESVRKLSPMGGQTSR
jgi:hypothetical protein